MDQILGSGSHVTATDIIFHLDFDNRILALLEKYHLVQERYWNKLHYFFPQWIKSNEIFIKVKEYLIKYERFDLLIVILGSGNIDIEKFAAFDDYLSLLEKVLTIPEDKRNIILSDSLSTHYIENIFNALYKFTDLPTERVIHMEIAYLPLLEYSIVQPKFISQDINDNPESFVELICNIYKPEGEDKAETEVNESSVLNAQFAFNVLKNWHTYPGFNIKEEKTRDDYLRAWCDKAITYAEINNRKSISEDKIGEILSRVPPPNDKIWPCLIAREFIEKGYERIKTGLSIGKYNSRGATTRSLQEGGRQEKELADAYFNNSKLLEVNWPETSKFLKEIGKEYLHEAEWFDKDAEKYLDP